jgi:hypothetical protein
LHLKTIQLKDPAPLDHLRSTNWSLASYLVLETVYAGSGDTSVDVPRLNARVTPVQNVDINCKPLTESTPDRQDDQDILTDVIKVDVYRSDYDAFVQVVKRHSLPMMLLIRVGS